MRGVLVVVCTTACGRAGFDKLPTNDGATDVPAGTAYVEVVRAANPIAYWRLGESVLPTAFDEGPNGWHGTYAASAVLGAPDALASDLDTAVELAGNTTGVVMPDVLDFVGTAPYSLEVWALPRTIDSQSRAFCGKKSGTEIGYSMFVNTSDTGFGRYDGMDIKSEALAAPIPRDVYSHVVGTFDGATLRLYINGVEVANAPNTIVLQDRMTGFAIGAKGNGTPGFHEGTLDEVAVYDRALSAAEVAAHYAAP